MINPVNFILLPQAGEDEAEGAQYKKAADGKAARALVREARAMRQHLTEKQIDETVAGTFPASDPPQWY